MSTQVLDHLREERAKCQETALALIEADDYDPSSDALAKLEERGASLDGQIERLVKTLEAQAAGDNVVNRIAKLSARETQQREVAHYPVQHESWGAAFIRSEEFRNYRGRGTSGMLELDLDEVQHRALPTGVSDLVAAGFKGAPYQVDTSPPAAPTPIMNNVTQVSVSSNALEYIAWQKKSGGATKVAEKSAKPSAEWGPVVTPSTLDNFAVYTQLTRQMIEDFPAVRSLIDGELQRDVARAEEADAAAVLAAASASIPDVTNADLLASIRMGIGAVEAAGYQASAVLLNPEDWAEMDVSIMGNTLGGPTSQQRFWGLTPISSSGQTAGTAVVGDFRSAVHHYYRSAISLYITDSHADTFLSNVFTLLAERRSKTVVVRPQALVEAKTS
jgi:hypothetical protein